MYKKRDLKTLKCETCGVTYKATRGKFCPSCREERLKEMCRRNNAKMAEEAKLKRYKANHVCEICGKTFETMNRRQILCGSRACVNQRKKQLDLVGKVIKEVHKKDVVTKVYDKKDTRCNICRGQKIQCINCYSIDIAGRPYRYEAEQEVWRSVVF